MTELLDEIKEKLQQFIDNTDMDDEKDVKRTINYLSSVSSHIDAINREKGFNLSEEQKVKLKRGQVVWVDFGFNIGKEFGGKHPAIILRVTSNYQSLLVVPIDGNPTDIDTINKRKIKDYWFEVKYIYGMKKMSRWVNVYRMTEISSIRVDFNVTQNTFVSYNTLSKLDKVIQKFQYKTDKNCNNKQLCASNVDKIN